MALTVQEMMAAANAAVERIDGKKAQELVAGGALLLDVRDGLELDKAGRAQGSHHISRGMLEFRADAATQFHDPEMRKDRVIVIHCASGGRAALAGKLLKDMGYQNVYNAGWLADWQASGGAMAEPADPGM